MEIYFFCHMKMNENLLYFGDKKQTKQTKKTKKMKKRGKLNGIPPIIKSENWSSYVHPNQKCHRNIFQSVAKCCLEKNILQFPPNDV